MKLIIHINNPSIQQKCLELWPKAHYRVDVKGISNLGKYEINDFEKIDSIQCDFLPTEEQLNAYLKKLSLSQFTCHILDHGVAYHAEKMGMDYSVNLERGNHNQLGLRTFQKIFSKAKSFSLSNEISKDKLPGFTKQISSAEYMVYGLPLLLTTPRPLLKSSSDWEEKKGKSEESPHKGFTFIQTPLATSMMNPKKICLLHRQEDLQKTGIEHYRLDLRFETTSEELIQLKKLIESGSFEDYEALKLLSKAPLFGGYFMANKSTNQFIFLKNKRLKHKVGYLGKIVDVKRDKYLVFENSTDCLVKANSLFRLVSPDGKECNFKVDTLKNLDLHKVESTRDKYILFPFKGAYPSQTRVYEVPE